MHTLRKTIYWWLLISFSDFIQEWFPTACWEEDEEPVTSQAQTLSDCRHAGLHDFQTGAEETIHNVKNDKFKSINGCLSLCITA